jgi:hypothetical protein
MAERNETEHISESLMERFCVRALTESELTLVARHLAGCPGCQGELVSTLRRQRVASDLSFTLAPEFWLRHEHLDYEQLVELGDDKLEAADREFIDAHLKVCPPCSEDVRSFLAFKDQIATEMRVSYAPVEQTSASERLTWLGWWRRLSWKPIYSAAVVVLGIALVIGAALLLKRRAENLQAQQGSNPQVNRGSTADNRVANVPSPPATPNETPIEKPNNAEVIIVNDRGGTVMVDKRGSVSGLDDVPAPIRNEIAQVLMSERLERPAILKELGGQQSNLRGSNTAQPFKLIYPSRTVIVSDLPSLKWEKASGVSSYRVYINDSAGHEVARSEKLPPERTEWILPKSLKRGETYNWAVVAIVDGKEIVSPGPSSPEMRFQVLSSSGFQRLGQLTKARSHLALGIFYARQGMLADAEREFQVLLSENPRSSVAKKLLNQIKAWRGR